MSRFLREPLVHFLALGVLLFVLFALFGGSGGDPDSTILVTEADVGRIAATWQRQWGRLPTRAELSSLVDQHIREEVLYREALAMGLDRDDTIVRRRLVQKIEFLSEDLALPTEPSEEDLRAWFEQERERYRVPARVSFTHVYLSRDRRGERTAADARDLLAELRAEGVARAPARGDRFMLQYDLVLRSEAEVARDFGSGFAAAVLDLTVGDWQGPVESGYGLHLVRVSERTESRLPELDEVRDEVRNDLATDLRRRANEDFYRQARERYRVQVQVPALDDSR